MEHRRLVIGLVILTLSAILGAGLIVFGSEEERHHAETPDSPEWVELEALLGKLKYTWKPARKARVLRGAKDTFDRLRGPLLELLDAASHPLLKEAIDLASAFDVTEARPALVRIASSGPENVRSFAILAAEKFEPWDVEEVRGFLTEGTQPVLLAALQLPSSRDTQLGVEVIRLLGHEDPEVRQAASKAIPEEPSPEFLEELMSVCQTAPEEHAIATIRALSRTALTAKVEAFMIAQMDHEQESIRMAALDALTSKGSRLRYPTLVWKFARHGYGSVREKAKAIVCLERTRSFEVFEIREGLQDLHPYLWYFAARCLITVGEREGVGILVDLLDVDKDLFGDLEGVDFGEVLYAGRKMLADLSNIEPSAEKQRFQEWYAQLRTIDPQPLLPPALNL